MTKKIKLSIIIVNFNTTKFVVDCLFSIFQSSFPSDNLEIILVDNDSKKKNLKKAIHEMLKIENLKRKIRIKIIENQKNLGFAKANNQGIKEAKGKYILLLNPDTLVERDTLAKMIDFMERNKNTGIATCRVVLKNGSLDDACHRGFPTPWRAFCYFSGISSLFPYSQFFNGYHLGYKDLTKVHEVEAVAGAFMLVRKEAGDSVGWLDEDYFWYGEDLDFCLKVKENGWKIMFVPYVKILHYKGIASGIKYHSKNLSTASKEIQALAMHARFQVMRIFYEKHYKKKYPRWLTGLILGGIKFKEYLSLFRLKILI